jgi:phosphoribosylanthranilate isomerase
METATLEALIAKTNELREKMRALQVRYHNGEASYEEMTRAAKAFCMAFDAYHKAKFGKGKKLDWRAVIR